jgi:hypothetical protein
MKSGHSPNKTARNPAGNLHQKVDIVVIVYEKRNKDEDWKERHLLESTKFGFTTF